MDGDVLWPLALGVVGVGMVVVAFRWLRDAPTALGDLPRAVPPPAPPLPEEDQDDDEDSIILGVEEIWVSPITWATWSESARRTARLAAVAADVLGVVVALAYLWPALTLTAEAGKVAAGVYAPVVGLVARYVVRRVLRRLDFARTAREMRDVVVPALVSSATVDSLLNLAHLGAGTFAPDSVIIRAEERGAATYLVATEYDVSKGEWIGGGDAGGGG